MNKSPKMVKVALLLFTGAVLVVSFATFTALFFKYRRGEDANNEDAIAARAEELHRAGDPIEAARLYKRLMALNPFEKRYSDAYLHELVAMRDFDSLVAATNNSSTVFRMTEDEQRVEETLVRGMELYRCQSNEQAIAAFSSVTNLNAFSATPLLVQALANGGQHGEALQTALDYTARFAHPPILKQAAEWSALARRTDLIAECRTRALRIRGRIGLSLAHYCDALIAWLNGSEEELAVAIDDLNGEIKSPLADLMKLSRTAISGTAEEIERAYDDVVADVPQDSQHVLLARSIVKGYLAKRFPSQVKLEDVERLSALILDPENPDVDILRLSLLAKSARGTLLPQELEGALKRFPEDRGLAVIKEQQGKR